MDREIESKWEGLMAANVLARSDDRAKRFVHYAESIVDSVEKGAYKDAIKAGGEFAVEYVQLPSESISPCLRNLIGKSNDLLMLLS
jgi:hypothetical protein